MLQCYYLKLTFPIYTMYLHLQAYVHLQYHIQARIRGKAFREYAPPLKFSKIRVLGDIHVYTFR